MCCGLYVKCSAQAHVLEHLFPGYGLGTFRSEDFFEEMRRGWEGGLEIVHIGPTSCPLSAS